MPVHRGQKENYKWGPASGHKSIPAHSKLSTSSVSSDEVVASEDHGEKA